MYENDSDMFDSDWILNPLDDYSFPSRLLSYPYKEVWTKLEGENITIRHVITQAEIERLQSDSAVEMESDAPGKLVYMASHDPENIDKVKAKLDVLLEYSVCGMPNLFRRDSNQLRYRNSQLAAPNISCIRRGIPRREREPGTSSWLTFATWQISIRGCLLPRSWTPLVSPTLRMHTRRCTSRAHLFACAGGIARRDGTFPRLDRISKAELAQDIPWEIVRPYSSPWTRAVAAKQRMLCH